nr:uncharacterized protein CTRU02_07889 [Colletotrichum truncatum]KAF6790983.1 hypothetical protein CTRU02_07889 [Colletotrichum truncatum]
MLLLFPISSVLATVHPKERRNRHPTTMPADISDKEGKPVKEGDEVFTPIRGGRHEGTVEKIVISEEEAESEGVKHPPKVLFTDQHGHDVSHNPGTLRHTEKD